ncbi:N-6 DNA methylase [Salmonella enterica subsp. enterica]|nr:N-6 DNA methylase [Salmonella enterica subsp. enterica]
MLQNPDGDHFLAPEGTMAIVLPHGVPCFAVARKSVFVVKAARRRQYRYRHWPARQPVFSTGIPVCGPGIEKVQSRMTCCLLTPANTSEKGKRQNRLNKEHISKIVDTYQFRKEEDRYSRRVPLEEIKANEI